MPELPEVETTRRGIQPYVQEQIIRQVIIRQPQLRWPVPDDLRNLIRGKKVLAVQRRGKYLLFEFRSGTLIVHLGMSGSLRVLNGATSPSPHDHLDMIFRNGICLRFRDPRRFGAVVWTEEPACAHRLLCNLGPEPLSEDFDAEYLHRIAQRHRRAVKPFIMDSRILAGIGNIYANESLFRCGIHPQRACNRISLERYHRLAHALQTVLSEAIDQGGTTLRDFHQEDGRPGYFALSLSVYAREGEPCVVCRRPIRQRRISQRSSYYCTHCQH